MKNTDEESLLDLILSQCQPAPPNSEKIKDEVCEMFFFRSLIQIFDSFPTAATVMEHYMFKACVRYAKKLTLHPFMTPAAA